MPPVRLGDLPLGKEPLGARPDRRIPGNAPCWRDEPHQPQPDREPDPGRAWPSPHSRCRSDPSVGGADSCAHTDRGGARRMDRHRQVDPSAHERSATSPDRRAYRRLRIGRHRGERCRSRALSPGAGRVPRDGADGGLDDPRGRNPRHGAHELRCRARL